MAKYRVSCYNGGPLLKADWVFIKPDEVVVEVDAETEAEAIGKARAKVVRDYYKVVSVS
jgi:hypothetical protein